MYERWKIRCRSKAKILASAAWLLAALAPPANCLRSDFDVSAGSVVSRDFLDPCLRFHWQLQTNPAHPEQPGRLILVNSNGTVGGHPTSASSEDASPAFRLAKSQISPALPTDPPIIRAGDRVTVDQQTKFLHAHFLAVALQSARQSQRIKVRLSAGTSSATALDGTVITVLATAPGQAIWPTSERSEP